MTFELLGRVHKELSITGHAFYETVLALSELVNRKVQIIRLHWQASTLLQRIDDVTANVGQQLVPRVSDRLQSGLQPESTVGAVIDETLADALAQVQDLKRSLVRVDGLIREFKLEAIHEDLLSLQCDLTVRSAGIERLTVMRGAAAAGQLLSALPASPSMHIATVLRGPFLLAPTHDLLCRPGDIVIVIGPQAELDQLAHWFTGQRPHTPSRARLA